MWDGTARTEAERAAVTPTDGMSKPPSPLLPPLPSLACSPRAESPAGPSPVLEQLSPSSAGSPLRSPKPTRRNDLEQSKEEKGGALVETCM